MVSTWKAVLCAGALAAVCLGAQAQTTSWSHLQLSGRTDRPCTVTITIGSEVFLLENIPTDSTATQVARDIAREINSVRHGHMYHAATNGVDASIVSIVADGSPTQNTTPWLGRLVPVPETRLEPGNCGLRIQRTNIQDTLVAVAVEGERAQVAQGEISVKLNGRTFTLPLNADDPETNIYTAEFVTNELSRMVNADPGFRSSVLRDDTGQLMFFITSENLGGGVELENGPTSVEGLRFSRARHPFAAETLYAGPGPR